jgi:hypothetical protein
VGRYNGGVREWVEGLRCLDGDRWGRWWLLCGSDSSLARRKTRNLTLDVVRKDMLDLVLSDRSFGHTTALLT